MYHNLADLPNDDVYTVSYKAFKDQINLLISEGFIIEGFDVLASRMITNQWPEQYAILTFDDGYKSNLLAAEILSNFNAKATFFIIKNFIQINNYLNKKDLLQLSSQFQIGSHSVTHPNLTKLNNKQILYELSSSKDWLEDICGKVINTFSIPNGFYNRKIVQYALDAGYSLIGNSVEWYNNPLKVSKNRMVNRIAIRSTMSKADFQKIIRQESRYFIKRRIRAGLLYLPKKMLR